LKAAEPEKARSRRIPRLRAIRDIARILAMAERQKMYLVRVENCLAQNNGSSKGVRMTDTQDAQTDMQSLNGKTILQIIPTLESGGAERTVIDMAQAIRDAGGRALVASAGGRLVEALQKAGGVHFTLPLDAEFRLDQWWTNRRHLIALCRREKVDLIHARSRAPAFAALSAARAVKVPFVTTYHGIYSEKHAFKRWYNSVMVAGDAVIANSAYTAELIRKRYKIADEKLHIVHRGTDTALFDPAIIDEAERAALKALWRIPDGRPIVMLIARLSEWKGHLLAVAAGARIKAEIGQCPYFIFAGRAQSEAYETRVHSAIAAAGLEGDIALVGHVDNVPLALSLGDLAIVPSTKPEAFGRAVAEASAMEVPVIAFDHGGVAETIAAPPDVAIEAATGLRVPPGDVDALADAIQRIIAMVPLQRFLMGKRGRARIETLFSKQQMVSKTIDIYARMLSK